MKPHSYIMLQRIMVCGTVLEGPWRTVFVMVSVTVVMRVGDNNQEDGITTLECEQTQSKLQETEGINGLKIKEIEERKIQKKKYIYIREGIDDEITSITDSKKKKKYI